MIAYLWKGADHRRLLPLGASRSSVRRRFILAKRLGRYRSYCYSLISGERPTATAPPSSEAILPLRWADVEGDRKLVIAT